MGGVSFSKMAPHFFHYNFIFHNEPGDYGQVDQDGVEVDPQLHVWDAWE